MRFNIQICSIEQSPPFPLVPRLHPSTVPLSNKELQTATSGMSLTNQHRPSSSRRPSFPTFPIPSDDEPPPFISRMIRSRETHDSNLEHHHHPHIHREQIASDSGTAHGSPDTKKGKEKGKGKGKEGGLKWVPPYDAKKPKVQRKKRSVPSVAPRLEGEEGFNVPGPSGSKFS